MIFVLYLGIIFAEIFSVRRKRNIEVEFDVIENKICKGYLKPINCKNSSFKAVLASESGSVYLSNENLPVDTETHFSFNISEPKVLSMVLTPIVIDETQPHTFGEIELNFSAQFDTFKKDVAKKVSVEPAMAAMTKLDNLLYELNNESEYLAHRMGSVDYEHRRMFSFVTVFSVITLVIYFGVNSYELYSLKKFFQKKKMI
ncbi:putative membrane integral protein [Encephalitozoon intestinalis ATCC 50506]|uniref:Membrane integral protein n=1 Tax=Encephalitozoon intestinalis (strain ATCC 50506) TaxID=876142 RepID=E0S5V4_ENCIT|nr:putative membrane integral protein [Encephalitozoon intestinalis ATCC 50506]ADM11089.1 putative membrane integral protein [Encephalitozoon intestinalis ATCC 50506]UTX44743.1 putative membrane integral protein [Encephalitozoon intestinalis]